MRSSVSRILILLLILCIGISLVAACGKAPTPSPSPTAAPTKPQEIIENGTVISAPGMLPITDKKIELTVFLPQITTVENYETNELTKYLEEQTNIHINFDLAASGDVAQKVGLILASGNEMPDIFLGGITQALLMQYADQGTFLPVDEYIDSQGLNIKLVFDQFPTAKGMMTAPDGHIYSLPTTTLNIANTMRARGWICKTWLDKLKLPVPKTFEELRTALKAFKDNDMNGNGLPDEIPMMGSNAGLEACPEFFFGNSYLPMAPGVSLYVDNDVVKASFVQEDYRSALRVTKSFVTDGLLDPVTYTQDNTQGKQVFNSLDPLPLVGFIYRGGPAGLTNVAGPLFRNYVPLPPLANEEGERHAYQAHYSELTSPYMVITKACKNPLAAFKWADFNYSEDVGYRSRLGVPELDWNPAPAGAKAVDGGEAKYVITGRTVWGTLQNSHWQNGNPVFFKYDNSGLLGDDPYELQLFLYRAITEKYLSYAWPIETEVPKFLYSPADSAELNEILAEGLESYINECRTKFILGTMDLDADWDAYMTTLKGMGYERYIQIVQARYDQYSKAK